MTIKVKFSALKQCKWYEFVIRFFFGGAITAATGLIAKHYGPAIGGLFLAFPAIFPASATLVEKHEKDKKRKAGIPGTKRGIESAALDARGAAYGTIALLAFAITIWKLLPASNAALTLFLALLIWLVLSVSIWYFCKTH